MRLLKTKRSHLCLTGLSRSSSDFKTATHLFPLEQKKIVHNKSWCPVDVFIIFFTLSSIAHKDEKSICAKQEKNQKSFCLSDLRVRERRGTYFRLLGRQWPRAQGASTLNRWYGRMGKEEEEATQWGGDTISQLLYLPLGDKSVLIP